jgi:PIN domain nuclease of toxin-antitoxin system
VSDYVADTHALYWYLTADAKLGAKALNAFQQAEQGAGMIYVLGIAVAEMCYLMTKQGRAHLFVTVYQRLATAAHIQFVDFRAEDVLEFDSLTMIPEMHDRIIAGVAQRFNLPCLTCDPDLINSGLIQTVW